MTSSTILSVTCMAITACVALFMVLSISLPQWYTAKVTDAGRTLVKAEAGLFKECLEAAGHRKCVTFKGALLEGV